MFHWRNTWVSYVWLYIINRSNHSFPTNTNNKLFYSSPQSSFSSIRQDKVIITFLPSLCVLVWNVIDLLFYYAKVSDSSISLVSFLCMLLYKLYIKTQGDHLNNWTIWVSLALFFYDSMQSGSTIFFFIYLSPNWKL